jgi:preprotein translocase subunit SecD
VKRRTRVILLVVGGGIAGIAALASLLTVFRFPQEPFLAKRPDHGVEFLIEAQPPSAPSATNRVEALRSTVRKRAARAGVRVYWEQVSPTRFRIAAAVQHQSAEAVRAALFRGGVLEFRLAQAAVGAPPVTGEPPAGFEFLECPRVRSPGPGGVDRLLVRRTTEEGLGGNLIQRAGVVRDGQGQPEIYFVLTPDAAAAFASVTRSNVGSRLAIIVDGKLVSAPVIRSPIEGGEGVIAGAFTAFEAVQLATALETPLPVAVTVIEGTEF